VKQAPDEITIVTRSPARAEALKQAITLRGFDEIACLDVRQAAEICREKPPVLVVVDLEGDAAQTVDFLRGLPAGVKSMVLADAFDEELFFACHDLGARDFMVYPVPEAMLVSRVIRNLQERRLEQVSRQKDDILVEMGVLSAQSGVFTTSYLINQLRQQTEGLNAFENAAASETRSLLILQMEGYPEPLPLSSRHQLLSTVGAIVKECSRGLDEVGEYFVDKFAVVMPGTSRRGAKALAKRLQQRLQGMVFEGANAPWTLSVKIGIAEYGGCRNYEEFLNLALADLKGIPTAQQAVSSAGQAAQESTNVASHVPPMSRPSNLI
jgi:PleD family two-component response regulator